MSCRYRIDLGRECTMLLFPMMKRFSQTKASLCVFGHIQGAAIGLCCQH